MQKIDKYQDFEIQYIQSTFEKYHMTHERLRPLSPSIRPASHLSCRPARCDLPGPGKGGPTTS
jgi:hypothetical protein